MSKYATKEDLYKAKADHYELEVSRLERELETRESVIGRCTREHNETMRQLNQGNAELIKVLHILENCLEFVDSGVPGYDEWKAEFDAI
jgi:hypothetical protein